MYVYSSSTVYSCNYVCESFPHHLACMYIALPHDMLENGWGEKQEKHIFDHIGNADLRPRGLAERLH